MPTAPRPRARVPASSRPMPSQAARKLASWQELTLNGNLAFEDLDDVQARRMHDEALALADELFDSAAQGGDLEAASVAPLLFGISCNNVVALARRQGDAETEGIFLYRVVERLLSVTLSPSTPLSLRSRCLLHLRVASETLYRYFELHGRWDAAASYSERANTAMFSVHRAEAALARVSRAGSAGVGSLIEVRQGNVDVVYVPPAPSEGPWSILGGGPWDESEEEEAGSIELMADSLGAADSPGEEADSPGE